MRQRDFAALPDRARGLLSGFPECCVDYFERLEREARRRLHRPNADVAEESNARLGWGYVPCPACVARDNRASVIRNGDIPNLPVPPKRLRWTFMDRVLRAYHKSKGNLKKTVAEIVADGDKALIDHLLRRGVVVAIQDYLFDRSN